MYPPIILKKFFQLHEANTAWSKSIFVIIVALLTSRYSLGVTGLADHQICLAIHVFTSESLDMYSTTYARAMSPAPAGLLFRNYSRFLAMPIILKIIPE